MRVRKNNPLNAAVNGPPQGIEVISISGARVDNPGADHI
jgi:hypothetical protein